MIREESWKAAALGMAFYNQSIFFADTEMNALCEITSEGKLRVIASVPRYNLGMRELFAKAECFYDKIYFSPNNSDWIGVYDSKMDRMNYIQVSDIGHVGTERKFFDMFEYNGCVYFFGNRYPAILELKFKNGKIEYHNSWLGKYKEIDNHNEERQSYYFGEGYAQYGSELYLVTGIKRDLLWLNMNTGCFEWIHVSCKAEYFISILADGDDVCLVSYGSKAPSFVIRNRISGNTKEVFLPEAETEKTWFTPIAYENQIFLFPRFRNSHIYRIDKQSLLWDVFGILDDYLEEDGGDRSAVVAVRRNVDQLIFIRDTDCMWITYDFRTDKVCEIYFDMRETKFYEKINHEIFHNALERNESIEESELPLGEFIKEIAGRQSR